MVERLHFEWDPSKNASNLRKHGIAFEEACTAFMDEQALLIDDPDHSDGEDRFILLGMSSSLRILVVCHCCRDGEAVIRIISARKADAKEEATYVRRSAR